MRNLVDFDRYEAPLVEATVCPRKNSMEVKVCLCSRGPLPVKALVPGVRMIADPPEQRGRSLGQRVLVDFPVFHDDQEILARIRDEIDVPQRIALDQQKIGQSTGFYDT